MIHGEVTPQRPLEYTIDIESLIVADHPLREVKGRAEAVLGGDGRGVPGRVLEAGPPRAFRRRCC